MRPSILYLVITAALSVLAVTMVAETPRQTSSRYMPAVEINSVGIDRDDAVDIACRVISNANDGIDGRITMDAKKTADGGWLIQARWTEEGLVQYASIGIDLAGTVIEYVK